MGFKMRGFSPFTKPNPRSKRSDVMSADQMRALRKMTDNRFDQKAKNFDYTPQTKKRRLVVDLKPQTVIDKKKK